MAMLEGVSVSCRRGPPMRLGSMWWTSSCWEVPQISQRESGAINTSVSTAFLRLFYSSNISLDKLLCQASVQRNSVSDCESGEGGVRSRKESWLPLQEFNRG